MEKRNTPKKINIHHIMDGKTSASEITKEKNVIKTTDIKLDKLKKPKAKAIGSGVKKNIYLDQKSWNIVKKVKETMDYSSISETIQALIKQNNK